MGALYSVSASAHLDASIRSRDFREFSKNREQRYSRLNTSAESTAKHRLPLTVISWGTAFA
jgi:hypothetical protein